MREMQRCKRDWSELPEELLTLISNHFKLNEDLCKFRAVCKKWRSSSPRSSSHLLDAHLPYQLPVNDSKLPPLVVRSAVYLLQPLDHTTSKPWLVSVLELNPGKLRLLPFLITKNSVTRLPYKCKTINLLDFRLLRIDEGLKLCFPNYNCDYGPLDVVTKVILVPRDDKAIVLDLYSPKLIACIKLENEKWRILSFWHISYSGYDDVVNFKGKAACVQHDGKTYFIKGDEPNLNSVISAPLDTAEGIIRRKLKLKLVVESSSEELYLVRELSERFEVYKLNEELHKWDKVNSLGERILIVTYDTCFFVDASKLPGFRGDCIIFPIECCDKQSAYFEAGVFYISEDCSRPVSSYPGLFNLFWPPHSCVLPDLSSNARNNSKELM